MDQTQNTTSPKYWMSLEQWRQDPDFRRLAEQEFMSSPLQSEDGKDGWARREFLKLMGASLALSSFGCVRRPAQKIIPYVNKPTEVTHGLPTYYASTYADGVEGLGILVTTRDGRPVKIEGNTEHPFNAGGMSARAHAHILKLYDPDRYTGPKRKGAAVKWEDLDKDVVAQLKKGKVALLTSTVSSPSTQSLIDDFASVFSAKTFRFDDICYGEVGKAQKASYGQPGMPRYHVEKARYIVAVNNDFLGTWLTPTHFQRQFARARKATPEMNKLVVFESVFSLTGTNADKRFRIRPSQSLDVVMGLLHELIVNRKVSRYASDAGVLKILSGFAKVSADLGQGLAEVAEDLWKNRGQSLVLVGGLSAAGENAVELQIAANFLNAVLENDGKTFEGVGAVQVSGKTAPQGIGELIAALNAKEIKTLIIHGANPIYALPPGAQFKKALAAAEMVIYTGDRGDETAQAAEFVAPDHHPLENWGDIVTADGTFSVQQPTIQPLFDTRAFQDSLLVWSKSAGGSVSARMKASETWYDYVNSYWKDVVLKGSRNFEAQWTDILQKGVHRGEARGAVGKGFQIAALEGIKSSARASGLELALYPTVGLGDGSLANVPWLQELPDPVSKICWDNYASFSPRDAGQLKIKEGAHVILGVGDQKVKVPAHIQPGQADGVVGLAVGYGRQGAGKVADGVGVNAFALAKWSSGRRVTSGLEVSVQVDSGFTPLASTQAHHTMEGRQIVIEETLRDHIKNPGGSIERPKLTTMWSGHQYPGHKWGMVIDLNTCTGCSACVIACQAENNVPTVGKKYVLDAREMHWLRVDRYYSGNPENPDVVYQPLPCMHCDNAPCETVCPVIATVHGDEGTNDMIYNRCVGTRYCSNNCPYKVRRFNWFNYNNDIPSPRHMALNPDVTTRFRGVMEKCTFCIHRIKFQKSQAKLKDRALGPNEVVVACQQSCPSGAITFGDLNNRESDVAKAFVSPTSYALLDELNVKPAVRYQVKVRNAQEIKGKSHENHEGKKEPHGSKQHESKNYNGEEGQHV